MEKPTIVLKNDRNKVRIMVKIVILIVLIGLFSLTTLLVSQGMTDSFDQGLIMKIGAMRSGGLNTLAETITYLGNWEAIVIICLLLLINPKTGLKLGVPVSAVAIGTTIVKAVVKPILERPRPTEVDHLIDQGGFSYPSGHSITSIGVFALLLILVYINYGHVKKYKLYSLLLLIPALGIGLSRVYLGVHYPMDVVGGWFAGLSVMVIALIVMEFFSLKPGEEKVHQEECD